MFSVDDGKIITMMVKLHNLAKRMERYGVQPLSEHRANPADPKNIHEWNQYVLTIVYDDVGNDDDEHIVYERVTADSTYEYQDMKVLYNKPAHVAEGYLFVAIPIHDFDVCHGCRTGQCEPCNNGVSWLSFVIGHDGVIETLDLEFIVNNIEEDLIDDSEEE